MPIIEDAISGRTHFRCTRLRGAKVGSAICQFCAVGCSQLAFFKNGELVNVEGDPRSPVNEGRQCPKGASTFALNDNPYRIVKPMYRAAGADKWKEVDADWILDEIAKRIWQSREKGFVAREDNGLTVNQTANIGFVGGSANDNEECYLFRKLMTGGLGILPVENTARYCHSTTVAALAPTFGFGACTNPPRDLTRSDCIIIMGSNMAEAHPVAFKWVMEARQKGAVTAHIDPRFTRTSAACDHHVPIRPATDIAFICAIIRHILENDLWFHDYVLHYTNAATLIHPDFAFDPIAGLFNGWNAHAQDYSDRGHTWEYQYETHADGSRGQPKTDPEMKDPHCVLQLLIKQVAPYTPEKAASICGCRPADIIKIAELMARNSGREKTTAFCYATGFTQHASGAQIIRSIAILQLLLGNIGRPGGGILALRGHSNVQGATDIPTLFNALPNYLPMPKACAGNATLKDYLDMGHAFPGGDARDGMWRLETSRGSWTSLPEYMVSLLKAWYGDAATKENEFGYQWLPKLSGNDSLTVTMERARRGEIDGMLVFGQNMAVTNPNTGWGRDALRQLRWLVVCDLFETETASVWYADPTAPDAAKKCQTEVFFLPASSLLETEGSATNTERLIQWHERVKASPDGARSDGWWIYQLGKRLKKMAAASSLERDAGLAALTWEYDPPATAKNALGLAPIPGDVDMNKVALEMNGYHVDTKIPCQGSGDLRADGSTICGCRLLSGFVDKAGENLSKRVQGGGVDHALDLDYRYAWPRNARILYNRCSADPAGQPWSENKRLIWWDGQEKRWTGFDTPDFDAAKSPDYKPAPDARGAAAISGSSPFGVHTDGKAWIFVPYGINDGPLPAYYEPAESPYHNILWKQERAPGTVIIQDPENPVSEPGNPEYPIVMTTYHMVEHWISGAQTRHMPWLVALQPRSFVEITPEMAEAVGIASGALIEVKSARATLQMRALVTPRIRIGNVEGKPGAVAGTFVNSGYRGIVCDPITNDLSPAIMAPEGLIPASKGFAVNITLGDPEKIEKFHCDEVKYPASMLETVPDTPWAAQPEGRN